VLASRRPIGTRDIRCAFALRELKTRSRQVTRPIRLSTRFRAVLAQRCPVCLQGRMFAGPFRMYDACPVCGHRFEREQGFFQGAMYISWVLGVTYLGVLALLAQLVLVEHIGITGAVVSVLALYMVCVPAVFRYSRVIWAHLNVRTKP